MANSRSDNGYAPSILQDDLGRCFLCYRRDRKLDRHEVFPASNRDKSKRYGLWVMLCHEECHQGTRGVHGNAALSRVLRAFAQEKAMETYGWSTEDFVRIFGKNWRD